jgi:hypothetical protein
MPHEEDEYMEQPDADRASLQASRLLRVLLERPGPYRSTWRERVRRERRGSPLNYDAIAGVLWHHQLIQGETRADDPRGLSDTVRRALTGQLSQDAAELFILAFRFRPQDAAALRRLLEGELSSLVVGVATPPASLRHRPADLGYETRSLHEVHTIGPDRRPVEHEISHVIQATKDRVTSYLYAFDTEAVLVEVSRGGTAGDLQVVSPDLWGVNIGLSRTLNIGESLRLEYRTLFHYDDPPEPEFRRAFLKRPARDLSVRVQFHPTAVPARAWWSEWLQLEDHERITREDEVAVDRGHGIEHYVEYIEGAVVGFRWEWTEA